MAAHIDTDLPSGVLTFLLTDVENSTPRWEADPATMRAALAIHDDLLDTAIHTRGGRIFKHTGDGIAAVFTDPESAAEAALDAQRLLQRADWGPAERLKIRIGLNLGQIEAVRGDYFGPPVNRAARVMDVANGDQIAVSSAVSEHLGRFDSRNMGDHTLRGIGTEEIHLISAPDLVQDGRVLRSRVGLGTRPLPEQPSRIIGREESLSSIAELLAEHKVVTIIGPGGVGKTRLAIDVAHAVVDRFPDGAVLCELSAVADPADVPDAVAESLGARVQPEMTLVESIVNFLEDRRALLILDNCEHVAHAVRDLGNLIARLPGTTILTTSREPLGLTGEHVFGLTPLDPATSAVELFVERAQERDSSYSPSSSEMAPIQAICERLDGMPLAIELAAAWVRVLSTNELLERLEDRFRMLRGGRSGGRHETLRDTILWSYEQLDDAQKTLFDRLSVFAGGFSLDAVEAVCRDGDAGESLEALEVLMTLVDKSMVMSERGAGRIRFRMLGTLRQFGEEQLDTSNDSAHFRSLHAEFFRELAGSQAQLLVSSKEAEVWELLDGEWSNMRAAFDTFLFSGELEKAAELLLELGWFATLSLRSEAFSWSDELHAAPGFEKLDCAGSVYGLRAIHKYITVHPHSDDDAEYGLALDRSDPYGFCRLALTATSLNNVLDADDSDSRTQEWLDVLDEDTPLMSRLWAHGMRTFHLCAHDPSPAASDHAAEVLRIAEASGSASAMAIAHWAGGMVATFDGIDAARAEWRNGLDSALSINEVHLIMHLIVGLELHFTASRGELDVVLQRSKETLEAAHKQHYLAGTSHLFGVTAIILARVGRAEIGARLLGSMLAHGHQPRGNAVRAIDKVLGETAEDHQRAGASLSTNEAAAIAIAALAEAIDERESR